MVLYLTLFPRKMKPLLALLVLSTINKIIRQFKRILGKLMNRGIYTNTKFVETGILGIYPRFRLLVLRLGLRILIFLRELRVQMVMRETWIRKINDKSCGCVCDKDQILFKNNFTFSIA